MSGFFWILLQFAAFTGLMFGIVLLTASHMRYRALTRFSAASADSSGRPAAASDLDPVQAFRVRLSTYLGSLHKEPRPFSLIVAALEDREGLAARHGEGFAAEAMRHAAERIRAAARKADACQLFAPDRIGVILVLEPRHLEPVVARLVRAVSATPLTLPDMPPIRIAIRTGAASYPSGGQSADEIFNAAEAALQSAAPAAPAVPPAPVPEPAPDAPAEAGKPKDAGGLLDELTGVLRPERLGGAMQKFIARQRKNGGPASLVLLDLDSLRRYNDHYGRTAGDTILRTVSAILQRTCREEDLIGRVEDDEFLLCMDCPPAAAERAAQRMVAAIKQEIINHSGQTLRVTACAGVAGHPDDGGIPRLLFEKAEIALMNAKSRGRAVVTRYQDTLYRPSKSRQMVLDRF